MSREETEYAVIHCSATPPEHDIGASTIDSWHKQRGWDGIGYHFVIRRDGTVESGRDLDEVGAHAQGINFCSIGICLVGGVDSLGEPDPNFTKDQMSSLYSLAKMAKAWYPGIILIGHEEVSTKACPSFNVRVWAQDVGLQDY